MSTNYPASAWNWDYYGEGTNILVEPSHGGASRIMGFTFNSAQTAGNVVAIAAGTVVDTPGDGSLYTIGVVIQTTASGAHGPVCATGVVRGVTASGAITAGARVIAAGAPAGSVKSGTTAGEVIGTAITAATTTGNTIVLFVHH